MSGAEADGADPSLPQLVLPLHATIRALQLKNGLRHGDYQRYRHYTTRRLRRLRKHAKATHHCKGRTFTVKPLDLDTLGGPHKLHMEHLLMGLLNAERAWAFAMQLKQQAAGKLNAIHRHHVKKRLKRAALWATRLQTLATQSHRVCERSVLEVCAYSAWLSATCEAECQHWPLALTHFNTAHSILAQLAQVGTLEEQDLFSVRAEEVQQSLRFVHYNLGQASSTDTQQLLASLHDNHNHTPADVPLGLREKLEAVLASSREEQATQLHELQWGHKTLTINSTNVALAVLEVQEASKALETSKEDNKDKDYLYTQVYECYDSALRETNTALAALQAMTSGAKVEDHKTQLTALQAYLSYHKLQWMLTRNEALVQQLHSSVDPKAEDLVHVYDALLQNVCEMLALPELEDMDELLTHTQALESYYRACRAYHLALFYAAPQRAQLAESLVLLDLCVSLCTQALPLLQATTDLAAKAKQLTTLAALAAGGRYRVQALSLLQSLGEGASAGSDVLALSAALGALSLSSAPTPTAPTPLLDRIQLYQAGSAVDGYGLPSLPPALSLLQVKPQLFELAGNHVMDTLPQASIKHKAGARSPDRGRGGGKGEQQDTGSKGFFGWLRG